MPRHRITDEGGIEPLLRGLASQVCQGIDPFVIDDVRNFLFGNPGEGGFDLVSLNIQRGRDHGLPSYNDVRSCPGPAKGQLFFRHQLQPCHPAATGICLRSMSMMSMSGLADWRKIHLPGALVGELIFHVVRNQFLALRDGDRFWYQLTLNDDERRMVENLRLADIIRLNTDIRDELPDNVFQSGRSEPRRPRRR